MSTECWVVSTLAVTDCPMTSVLTQGYRNSTALTSRNLALKDTRKMEKMYFVNYFTEARCTACYPPISC